jgi:ATP-dependent helicase HrpB
VPTAPAPTGLPVEDVVGEIRSGLADPGAVVLQAEPGAGKTTVVPLRLLDEAWLSGAIVVLEPRRVAARAAAARMASLLGEGVGATVGLTTRDDRRRSSATRIEVVTEGILTRRLQADPSLPGVGLVIFDEFHERHLQGDLGLALTLDARDGLRRDLRVLVMSATLDTGPLASLLGGAAVVTSAGRGHPVALRWSAAPVGAQGRLGPGVGAAVRSAMAADPGDVLVFLPGVGEIAQVGAALAGLPGADVLALHGSLPAADQDRALRAGPRRRVVLSTDLAESSVTVEGVGIVVDAGLTRRPAYDPSTGLSRLRTGVGSRASADQRAGRAGRLGPGVAHRLWPQSEHQARRPWPDPEIVGADLAGLALELAVWGAAPGDLRWLDAPPAGAMAVASALLEQLGAMSGGRPTTLGRRLAEVPLHPRLGAMLIGAAGPQRETATLLAALLSERDVLPRDRAVPADVAERLAVLRPGSRRAGADRAAVAAVRRRAGELGRRARPPAAGDAGAGGAGSIGADPGGVLVRGYPDRIAQARGGGRFRLRHGGGAALPATDPLAAAPWIVAVDVDGGAGDRPGRIDGRIRMAAAIGEAEVEAVGGAAVVTSTRAVWDDSTGDLRQVTERRLDDLILSSVRGAPAPGPATTKALVDRAVATGLSDLGWGRGARTLQARALWARRSLGEDWPDVSDEGLAGSARDWLAVALGHATGKAALQALDPVDLLRSVLGRRVHDLDRLLPVTLRLAGGRSIPVDYGGERPTISVRAQDLFGTTVHPTVAGGRVPVTVEVLSPAGRPVQVTADLPTFWAGSWRDVRKEMAGRYPRHPWPTDPARASPPPRASRRPAP